eukprot:CAMPEP_0176388030 /NCGR_PEP_ID=MMETSP0126-20121128/37234_1 /TAXON_ID=141414 ORGANISM="Strombidinopsis acuminatum, Strain SPMC142" /NCGR_SAMPLE_ID=MMETSP0126 /ASSEMBLY_ACC=CAM_ASM_000229 /LENGTH=171 /DNA_ID=CAMNT_0017755967 /DNA_START=610 /DNA_END=1125 /DNA_ORIENTATION=-
MLGNNSILNFSSAFIEKLYESYTNPNTLMNIQLEDPEFFIQLANDWPFFIKNNPLLSILNSTQTDALHPDVQSRTLEILTKKNVLNPSLITLHFNTFMRLTDKEAVKKHLKGFLNSCAYLGYTDSLNIEKLSQVLRRVYKNPESMELPMLLDYLVVLALSNSFYKAYDEKT